MENDCLHLTNVKELYQIASYRIALHQIVPYLNRIVPESYRSSRISMRIESSYEGEMQTSSVWWLYIPFT